MFRRITLQTSNNRGMALVATLVMTLVLSTIAIAMLSLTTSDIKLSSLQEGSKEAFYIAEAGVDRAIAYLEDLGNPDFPIPINPFMDDNGGSPVMGDGNYTVTIKSTSPLSYTVESVGVRPWSNDSGKISTTIVSEVLLDNFAMFAYFSDNELFPRDIDAGYGGKEIWFQGGDTIEGRLHSNDRLNMAGSPTFYGTVSSAYRNPSNNDTSWQAYDKQTKPNFFGTPGFQGGVDRIELPVFRDITEPKDSKSLQRIAAGSEEYIVDKDKGNGTYLPNYGGAVTNGIWVKGDVKEMVLGTHSSGNSKIFINQAESTTPKIETTIYTIDPALNSPIFAGGKTYSSGTLVEIRNVSSNTYSYDHYDDHTNGVLFVNGEIKSLKSTDNDGGLKGKMTIASNRDISISDDIKYNARVNDPDCFVADNGAFPDFPDSLGLVTEGNIKILENAPNNIEINAIMMALGTSFYYEGFKSKTKDILTVYGSFIQKQRGPVGTFSASSRTGYTKNYHFDTRMNIDNPNFGQVLPPYFPTTGKYIKLWWKEI